MQNNPKPSENKPKLLTPTHNKTQAPDGPTREEFVNFLVAMCTTSSRNIQLADSFAPRCFCVQTDQV